MEKQQANANLPPNYINLGYDSEPVAGPSAPRVNEGASSSEGDELQLTALNWGSSEPGSFRTSQAACNPCITHGSGYSEKIVAEPTPPPKYDDEPISFGTAPTAPQIDPRILHYNPPSLVFEDIYEACIGYVRDHCCYSSRFANRMKLTEIENGCAYYYVLESYAEKRESAYDDVPYKGGPIDSPSNGRAPDPWEMYVPFNQPFVNAKTEKKIPHTDSVETCWRCSGSGEVSCSSCSGSGKKDCWRCNGSGRDSEDGRCSSCSGDGTETCSSCSGSGVETCSKCDGYGKVKRYRVLFVTWTNHITEFVSDVRQLPAKNMKKVTGDALFSETADQLSPLDIAPDDSVNAASLQLLEAHNNSFPSELIRTQRHNLRGYPFTVAKYKYKEEEGEFYIYGKEKEVYFQDYPTDCCCCICC